MIDIILDTLLDGVKLLPFLFLTYLAMEALEHKTGDKFKFAVQRSGRFGPILGALLGIVPQCGFSAAASNLYVGRIITLGTLFSVYLSTSDEMLPILISEQAPISLILKILALKVGIGMVVGLLIDVFHKKKILPVSTEIHTLCEKEKCHCEESLLKSAIKHTLQIFGFILLISFVLNCVFDLGGEKVLESVLKDTPMLGLVLSTLVGLIPNCASSVVLTELFLEDAISFACLIAGLLVNAGVGLLVLFKLNKNKKECIGIVLLLFSIGLLSGGVLWILA